MEDACRHRYGWACYSLAIRYLEGNGVEENDFKAVLLLDDACIRLPEVCEDAAELRAQYRTDHEPSDHLWNAERWFTRSIGIRKVALQSPMGFAALTHRHCDALRAQSSSSSFSSSQLPVVRKTSTSQRYLSALPMSQIAAPFLVSKSTFADSV